MKLGKFGLLVSALAFVSVSLLYAANSSISANDQVRYGDATDNYAVRIGTSSGSGYAVLTGEVKAGSLNLTSAASSLTNGAALAVTKSVHILTGTGGANDTTNTITLSEVSAALVGTKLTLIVDASSSNLITIADSGFPKLAGAWVGDNNDSIELYISATNSFIETSRSDN